MGERKDALLDRSSGVRRRRRRILDGTLDPFELERIEEEARDFPEEALADVKAASLKEWVTMPGPMGAIKRAFKEFLTTFLDEEGQSVYGRKIKRLGEGRHSYFPLPP